MKTLNSMIFDFIETRKSSCFDKLFIDAFLFKQGQDIFVFATWSNIQLSETGSQTGTLRALPAKNLRRWNT
ncbi:MAG: hypothetical protein WCL14_00885 [Bacteroidota bacterium]